MVLRCRDGHKSGNTAMQLQLQSVKIVTTEVPRLHKRKGNAHARTRTKTRIMLSILCNYFTMVCTMLHSTYIHST